MLPATVGDAKKEWRLWSKNGWLNIKAFRNRARNVTCMISKWHKFHSFERFQSGINQGWQNRNPDCRIILVESISRLLGTEHGMWHIWFQSGLNSSYRECFQSVKVVKNCNKIARFYWLTQAQGLKGEEQGMWHVWFRSGQKFCYCKWFQSSINQGCQNCNSDCRIILVDSIARLSGTKHGILHIWFLRGINF